MSDYRAFLASKRAIAPQRGIDSHGPLADHLFRFQRGAVSFGLNAGSWGLFFDTGLGKTACELDWCRAASEETNGRSLILTPLAVARQIEREGKRWGYQARVIRDQSEAADGINICNYDRLEKLDPSFYGAVALDEASVLKSFTGKTTRLLIDSFAGHRWRLAATATPAPNDHMELGQHSEFLGVMPSTEMLMRWFIADQTQMGRYRLKGHAIASFYDWMASWCRMAEHPRDLGDDVPGFDLPPLKIHRHRASEGTIQLDGALFGGASVSATEIHKVKRQTADARAAVAVEIAIADPEPCVIWTDTDYEADAVLAIIGKDYPSLVEVRGSHPIGRKEDALAAFADGTKTKLLSKPSVCGWGLNWQFCNRMVYVGRSFSYESFYQSVRRCWRFGQKRTVDVHLILADGEDHIGDVINRKSDDHARMKVEMAAAMRRAKGGDQLVKVAYEPTYAAQLPTWLRAEA